MGNDIDGVDAVLTGVSGVIDGHRIAALQASVMGDRLGFELGNDMADDNFPKHGSEAQRLYLERRLVIAERELATNRLHFAKLRRAVTARQKVVSRSSRSVAQRLAVVLQTSQ